MKVIDTALAEVKLIEPVVFGDDRGWLIESWNRRELAAAGIAAEFVQDNHSYSARNVLRGLHYQLRRPQGKLVRVIAGSAFDVAVDLRRASSTFGRWAGAALSAENKRMMWIPPGFAHGFLSLEDGTEFVYKCTDFYDPADERALLWCDPAIGIAWPLGDADTPRVSPRDRAAPVLAEAETYR